tara:strand:- start:1487 stop:2548 length:1062 start_codon:yes stop_codon:yes gene_type:complete
MTVLITGGAGFVGSNLAIYLKKNSPDNKILCLDNLKRRGSELNLARLKKAGISFIHGDIRSKEDLNIGTKIDLIIECSADASAIAGFGSSPEYVLNTNLIGTINCLELARRDKSSFIFLSSSRVYPVEKLEKISYTEEATKLVLKSNQPYQGVSGEGISVDFPLEGWRSMYGTAKLASELIIHEYVAMYDIQAVINRCGVIAGPWQMGKVDQGVFALWMLNHYFKRNLQYIGFNGSGKQVRDILHIDDLSQLVLIESKILPELNGKTFNVGGGRQVSLSLLETTSICEEITGNNVKITPVKENRPADIPIYISDNKKVISATGWSPQKNAKNIMENIFEWISDNEHIIKQTLM